MQPIIDMQGIVKRYYIGKPNELEILHGIDLQVYPGEFVAIVGESGSGKSTLMNIIGALDRPTEGGYTLDGVDITRAKDRELSVIRNRKIGFVFQTFNLIGRTSALKNVELPMLYAGVPARQRTQRAKELLEMVNMGERARHQPNELSGGQKQRVAIAGIIAMETKCIVLDEPTAMLDPRGRTEVMETIQRLNREKGITIVLITHYMDEAVQAGRVVVMDEGEILRDGTPRQVFSDVEFLKRHDLDVPQATELSYRLAATGIKLPGMPLGVEECVSMFRRYLAGEAR